MTKYIKICPQWNGVIKWAKNYIKKQDKNDKI